MIKETLQDAREHMDETIEALHIDLRAIRTRRASPALVERLQVEYYGVPTPLNQFARTTIRSRASSSSVPGTATPSALSRRPSSSPTWD